MLNKLFNIFIFTAVIFSAHNAHAEDEVQKLPGEEVVMNEVSQAQQERNDDEIFPWDFIDCGVTKEFLLREWKKALGETVSPNCRMQCQGCGANRFGGGVCYEAKN